MSDLNKVFFFKKAYGHEREDMIRKDKVTRE